MPSKRKPSTKMKAKGMICTEPECGKPVESKMLCNSHYERMMRDRRKEAQGLIPVRYEKLGKYCKRDDCNDRTTAKNLCRKHYYEQRALILKKTIPCREEGCGSNAIPTSFLCMKHKLALGQYDKQAMLEEAKRLREELLTVHPEEPRVPRIIVEPLKISKKISFIKFGYEVTAVESDDLIVIVDMLDKILSRKGYVPMRFRYDWSPKGYGVNVVYNSLHPVQTFVLHNV